MNCESSRLYLGAFVDGELSVADHLMIEAHIAECAKCRADRDQLLAMRSTLRDELREELPAGFEHRLRASLRPESKPSWGIDIRAIAFAAVALVVIVVVGVEFAPAPGDRLIVRDVVASHVRSLQSDHLMDVASSDHHTVKPWFQGKLDFSPPVPELGGDWKLDGGRLDYVDGHPVAALIYQHREHRINAYIWPSHGGSDLAVK